MDLNEAMRTGLPIAIGGAIGRHPDDGEDMIEEAMLPTLAQEVSEFPAQDPEPLAQPDAPGALEADIDAILQRIESIEQRMRSRLGLHRIHEALDRVDALLN